MSLHVTIVIKHETLLDFLNDLCREHPGLNRPLRALLGSESVAQQAAALRTELVSRFDQTDVAERLTERNAGRASVTGLDLRAVSDAASGDGIAALTVTMIPPQRPGRRWKVGGIDFQPGDGAPAVVSVLKAGPLPVSKVLDEAGREVGLGEARAGLDQLVSKGIVQIDMPVRVDEPASPQAVRTAN